MKLINPDTRAGLNINDKLKKIAINASTILANPTIILFLNKDKPNNNNEIAIIKNEKPEIIPIVIVEVTGNIQAMIPKIIITMAFMLKFKPILELIKITSLYII